MSANENTWPRIRDLPEAEREPFRNYLEDQNTPMVMSLSAAEQDFYYPDSYQRWKAGYPTLD